jgi:hypothetical protein
VLASSGAIALPMRQTYDFTVRSEPRVRDSAIPIPIPYERRRNEDDLPWFHYTTHTGIIEIAATGIIRANNDNIVFVTRSMYGRDEVLDALFMGDRSLAGRGDYYVGFVAQDGVVFLPAGAVGAATQANEWVHFGSLRFPRQIKYFFYIGPNPY